MRAALPYAVALAGGLLRALWVGVFGPLLSPPSLSKGSNAGVRRRFSVAAFLVCGGISGSSLTLGSARTPGQILALAIVSGLLGAVVVGSAVRMLTDPEPAG